MSLKGKIAVIIIAAGLLALSGFLIVNPRTVIDRETIKNSQLLLRLRPLKLSLIKLPDIIHFPYWLRKTKLETYYLEISDKNIIVLNERLPKDLYDGKLEDENKFFVKGFFKAPGYESGVRVRYRGFGSNHWNSQQKSYLIRFPSGNLFKGMKSLTLIIAYDRGYFAENLTGFRARKLGLDTPEFKFVRLRLNDRDNGVYLAVEQWSEKWLAKQGIQDNSSLYSITKDASVEKQSLFSLNDEKYWKDYTPNTDFEPLKNLSRLMENADEKTFARFIPDILDMEKFYKWATINIISGSFHQSEGTMVLLFNRATGKFEPIPWDVNHYLLREDYFSDSDLLTKRILSIQEFYNEFKKAALAYATQENLAEDLSFYDKLLKNLKPEFYGDRTKFHNDFMFLSRVKKQRSQLISNFAKVRKLLTEKTPFAYQVSEPYSKVYFSGSFSYLPQISLGINEFVARFPQFKIKDNKTLILPNGIHIFNQNVIVPKGLTLVIEPAAVLLFDKSISLISYSSIVAVGLKEKPISFLPLDAKNPWGVVAISNAGKKESIFSNSIFKGGSFSSQINGVVYTGMLSFHNSDTKVISSRFLDDLEDDAVNVKYGNGSITYSYFVNNGGDAVDIDGQSDFVIANNFFLDNGYGPGAKSPGLKNQGGDAIDVSFSKTRVENNTIKGCGDKGISIGENSESLLENNIIVDCFYGIAVKDSSRAYLRGNKILANKIGISLYQKKTEFEGGFITAENLVLWANENEVEKDAKSSYTIKNSVVEGGLEGENNSSMKPNFAELLPAFIFNDLKRIIQ